jgi:DNA-binding GntR family transcriptional regulator
MSAVQPESRLEMLVPPGRETLQERVYLELKAAIMCGRFPPGQSLTIRALATALRTSTMPVREALRQLAVEQAVINRANRSFAIPLMSRSRFEDLVRIRSEVEGYAASQAATKIDAKTIKQVAQFEREIETAAENQDPDRYISMNQQFHFTIYREAGSEVLMPIIEMLWVQGGPYLKTLFPKGKQPKADLRHHEGLLKALRRRDPQMAREMRVADIADAARLILASAEFLD